MRDDGAHRISEEQQHQCAKGEGHPRRVTLTIPLPWALAVSSVESLERVGALEVLGLGHLCHL